MKQFHAKRLLKLAEFLRNLPKNKFDMRHWFLIKGEDRTCSITEKSCGTVGCALGWAGTIPEFRKEGLVTDKYSNIVEYSKKDIYVDCFDAGAEFFGITEDESMYIFDPEEYVTNHSYVPKHRVVNRIKSLVKKYHPELL